MLLKVKYDELEDVTKSMTNDSDSYDTEIDKMLKEIAKLSTIWEGQDAEIFCRHFTEYLTRMKQIPAVLRNMSKFIDKASKGYSENDDKFSRDLEKEATNYDEQDSDNEFSTVPGSN